MNPPEHNIDDGALLSDIQQIESGTRGKLCFAFRDMETGRELHYRADEKCKTASTIKFPMLVHIALAVQEGALNWNEKLKLTDAEKVAGSGVLTQLGDGLELSLRDVCVLMTIVSDNTATNMIVERFGVEAVNNRSRELGLEITTLFRKSYHDDTPESAPYGLGVTTPAEMCALMAMVARKAVDGDAACTDMIKMMEAQQYRDCISRLLPADWNYAGKTGSVDAVRNDVGLITSPDGKRFVLAAFCQELPLVLWTADNPGMIGIAKLAHRLMV